VAELIFSKASLTCAEPFSAVARNACVASNLGELAGLAAVVLVVDSNMTLILWAFPAEDFRTRNAWTLIGCLLIKTLSLSSDEHTALRGAALPILQCL
jgi:hypothetical protein